MLVADLAPAVPSALRRAVAGVTIKVVQRLPLSATGADFALHFVLDDDDHDLASLLRLNTSQRVNQHRARNAARQSPTGGPHNDVS